LFRLLLAAIKAFKARPASHRRLTKGVSSFVGRRRRKDLKGKKWKFCGWGVAAAEVEQSPRRLLASGW